MLRDIRVCGWNLGGFHHEPKLQPTTTQQSTPGLQTRTQSVTKTIRELGRPGAWTLYTWLHQPAKPGRARRQATTLTYYYPFAVKLRAVELYNNS